MLPFSMRDAIIASVLTASSHTVVLSVCLSSTVDHVEPLVWQVSALPSVWLCACQELWALPCAAAVEVCLVCWEEPLLVTVHVSEYNHAWLLNHRLLWFIIWMLILIFGKLCIISLMVLKIDIHGKFIQISELVSVLISVLCILMMMNVVLWWTMVYRAPYISKIYSVINTHSIHYTLWEHGKNFWGQLQLRTSQGCPQKMETFVHYVNITICK